MANKKISALTALTTPASGDLLAVVDVSDTTDAASGTTKKIAVSDLVTGGVVPDDSVTNAKLANMAQATIKGRASGAGTGDPTDLSSTQATAILDNVVGDSGSGGTKGLVPAPGAGDAAAGKFLKADGTFAVPAGTGASTSASYITKVAEGGLSNEFALGSLATGLLKNTTTTGVPTIADVNDVSAPVFAQDAGSNDTYTATLSPAPSGYVTGTLYRFKANTANTGACTINFNSLGAKTIKKAVGGVTTDLDDNDIRAGQWVDVVYDGTNMQMQSNLGNVTSGGAPGGSAGGDLSGTYPNPTVKSNLKTSDLTFIIDGGGSTITTGVKGDLGPIDFACTINSVTLLADQSGSIVIDVWKDTYANYPPTVADTITASAKPTLSSAAKSQDSTLTGWTTSISAGDTLRFNVDSITTCQRVTLTLKVTLT